MEIPEETMNTIKEHAKLCYQCGVCMGSCPVARVNEIFHPRRMMREIILDGGQGVVKNEAIWLCAQCYMCSETCPQGVGIADLIIEFRNLAVSLGVTPPDYYTKNIKQISETGRLASLTSRVERLRDRLKLSGIEPLEGEEIRSIISNTKLDEMITKTEGN